MARPAAAYEAAVPPRPACAYTSCYCEENVWKLCDYIRSRDRYPLEEFYAVFISNDRRMIPLWKQKSGHGDEPVVWENQNYSSRFVLEDICFRQISYEGCKWEMAETSSFIPLHSNCRMSHVRKPLLQAKLLLTRKFLPFLTLQSQASERQLLLTVGLSVCTRVSVCRSVHMYVDDFVRGSRLEGWTGRSPKVPSNPCHSVIL